MKRILILTLLLIFSVTLFAERKAKYKFRENGKYGLLDNHGKIILPAEYDSIDYLRYGMIPAIKGTYAVFIKENGEIIDKKICSWHSATYLDNVEYGLVPVKDCETGKWGLLGKSGEYTVEPIYDKISSSHNGMVKAELKGKTISIDIRDKVKGSNGFPKEAVTNSLSEKSAPKKDNKFTGTPDAQCEFNDGDNYYLKGNREMIVNSDGFIKFEQKVDEKRLKGFKEFKGKTMNLLPFSFQNLKYDNDPCNYAIRMGVSASHEDWQPALSILSKNQSYDPTFAIEKELEEKRTNIALNEKAIKWMESNENNSQYADQIKELKEDNKKLEKECKELEKKKKALEQ